MVINRKGAVQRFAVCLAHLSEYQQHLLMHLFPVSVYRLQDGARPTQELSEIDMTRGASSDDLLTELLEPLDTGEAKPWLLVLVHSGRRSAGVGLR
jgi:hypothetical protein